MEPKKGPDSVIGRFGGLFGVVGGILLVLLVAWLLGII